jgi:anti-sigma factor RsiW
MSTQDELAENLTAYIDGELSELEARRVEEALKSDPTLAALERKLRVMVAAVEKMEAPAPSMALRRAVLSQLDEPGPWGRLLAMFTLPRLVPAVGLAAAALVSLVLLRGKDVEKAPVADAETLFLAQNMDVVEDLDVLGLENPEDLEVVENLHELEATP